MNDYEQKKPKLYDNFLVLQADNIKCSVGNVALTMKQLEGASKIGSTAFWHNQGRYVRDEEMASGAKVFVPPRDPKQRGYLMGDYYDISQTEGKPMKEIVPLAEDSERLDTAIMALLDATRAGFTENETLETPAWYNEETCTIEINSKYSKTQVFAALATEVSYGSWRFPAGTPPFTPRPRPCPRPGIKNASHRETHFSPMKGGVLCLH